MYAFGANLGHRAEMDDKPSSSNANNNNNAGSSTTFGAPPPSTSIFSAPPVQAESLPTPERDEQPVQAAGHGGAVGSSATTTTEGEPGLSSRPHATQGTESLSRLAVNSATSVSAPFGAGPQSGATGSFGSAGFGGVVSSGYGRSDLVPDSGMHPAGSSLIGRQNFQAFIQGGRGRGGGDGGDNQSSSPFACPPGARYDPMFPGDDRPAFGGGMGVGGRGRGFGMVGPGGPYFMPPGAGGVPGWGAAGGLGGLHNGAAPPFPGEPDNDLLPPPGGFGMDLGFDMGGGMNGRGFGRGGRGGGGGGMGFGGFA